VQDPSKLDRLSRGFPNPRSITEGPIQERKEGWPYLTVSSVSQGDAPEARHVVHAVTKEKEDNLPVSSA